MRWLPFAFSLATAVAAIGTLLLIAGLPAEGFFSGDAGVKLIAARNALAHPRRPFDIDLPTIGTRPAVRVDPMIVPHDDHAHVLQSPVFPVVSAPVIAAFGLRGAYVLPAVGFMLMVPLLEAVRRVATPTTPPLIVAALAVVANPLFFYGLEFWEHAPAIALLAASTALMVRLKADPTRTDKADPTKKQGMDPTKTEGTHTARSVLAGALAGIAILFRPEAALYALALVVAFRPSIHNAIALAGGAAVVLAPLSIASYVHSGSFLGTHLTNTLAPISRDWLSGRFARISTWVWPDSLSEAAALLALAAAWVTRPLGISLRARQAIGLVGVAWLSMLAAGRGLDRNSIWQAFPIAAFALVPLTATKELRRFQLLALISVALVLLTATHDGGAQWGPRFLLIITPPVIVLAAAALSDVLDAGSWRWARVTLTVLILLGALLTSRAAYRELRGAKATYAQIVDATRSLTEAGETIVTNVWWFDQIAAPLYGTRTFLYVPDRAVANDTLRELDATGERRASLVWTNEPEGEPLDSATERTCYRVLDVKAIPERQLVFASTVCRP